MKYDVTIGIPVFNSVAYLQRSLMSALNQTFPSVEFLVVDDCSTDSSMELVARLKKNHHRGDDIHILYQSERSGISAARNRIIDEAQGEFLYFMDSDDVISENAIEILMRSIRSYDAEIAFGSYEKIDVSGQKNVYQYPSLQLLKSDELASFAYRKYAGLQASACNYLIRTSLLRENNHRFIETNYWEDLVFTFDLVTLVSKAVLLPDITYSYLCREGSLSHYQQRDIITKSEIMQNVRAIDYLKQTSSLLYNKVYFPNRCYNIVMSDFYIACNILKRRMNIQPQISNREIRDIMCHPATFMQICRFKQSRTRNLLLYMIGRLPSFFCVAAICILGKMKKLL